MNTELKKAYEIVKKEYFIQDFLEAVKSRGGIGSLLYEEVKKNKVLQDCAYIFFKNYSNKIHPTIKLWMLRSKRLKSG